MLYYINILLKLADQKVLNANSVIETLVGWYKVLKNVATVATAA